ncbi:MAG TPA: BON domain-containing protein [Terriglobales bacterium]|nr:BON domain-containing protein [Terriglobales bacterium]
MRFTPAIRALGCIALGACFAAAQVAGSALDHQIASYLQQQLSGSKDLAQVHSIVEDRVVTLTGSVTSYRAKLQADHDARQVQSVNGVINQIHVGGPTVPDAQLQRELSDRLTYDRIGMGQTFNALTLEVKNGVVTIGGDVRDYPDRDSAVDIVADTKGVKGLVDHIKVAPLSPMDDQIRFAAARAIYGNPSFVQYANNPAHPIRIAVANGHVTLEGVVTSQVDKTMAGNAVRSLPGVFSVKNNLVVAH